MLYQRKDYMLFFRKNSKIENKDLTYEEFYNLALNCINSSKVLQFLYKSDQVIKSIDYVIHYQSIKISELQTELDIGYATASRLFDFLEELHIISKKLGSSPRKIYISTYKEALEKLMNFECNKEMIELYNELNMNDIQIERVNSNMDSLSLKEIKSGIEFENFCSKLLIANGFLNVTVTQASNDYGVDILAEKDSIKYAIQCKFYNSPVGNSAIQEVCTGKSYYNCHIAVVLTNATFTKNAIELADRNNIILWDYRKLNELINSCHNI